MYLERAKPTNQTDINLIFYGSKGLELKIFIKHCNVGS